MGVTLQNQDPADLVSSLARVKAGDGVYDSFINRIRRLSSDAPGAMIHARNMARASTLSMYLSAKPPNSVAAYYFLLDDRTEGQPVDMRTFWTGTVLVLGMSAAAAEERVAPVAPARFADYYVATAFASESGLGVSGLLKWRGDTPIDVYTFPQPSVSDETFDQTIDMVEEVADTINARRPEEPALAALDSGEMSEFVLGAGKATLESDHAMMIYVGSQPELAQLAEVMSRHQYQPALEAFNAYKRGSDRTGGPLCFAVVLTAVNEPFVITKAFLLLENTNRLDECLYEELMQSFGIINDLPAGTPSMFNDDQMFDRPTSLDWQLWCAHTDKRMKAGMTEREARETLGFIAADDSVEGKCGGGSV